MTEHEALVTAVEGEFALLEAAQAKACGSCAGKKGCGTAGAARSYAVRNTIGARPGDEVVVSVPEGAVFKAAAFSYLMPVLFVIAGAVIGTAWGGDGLPAVGGAALGLVAGIGALRLAALAWRGREPWLTLRFKRGVNFNDKEI